MMIVRIFIFIIYFISIYLSQAASAFPPLFLKNPVAPAPQGLPPLKIYTLAFTPPFVFQGAHKRLYGFDIAMMNSICAKINRTCTYTSVNFDELIEGVLTDKADIALGAITITPERAKIIHFSIPYLTSHSRFIALANFKNEELHDLRIGVVNGTIFANQIKRLNLKNPNIIKYKQEDKLIAALSQKNIDVALIDNESAIYWQNQSNNVLKVIGKPMPYGLGYGIAVSPIQIKLLRNINNALLAYQNSPAFTRDYQMYLEF